MVIIVEQMTINDNNDNNDNNNDNGKRRLTKNEKRRVREKSKTTSESNSDMILSESKSSSSNSLLLDNNITIEYISPNIIYDHGIDGDTNILDEFKSIFQKFTKPEELISISSDRNNNNQTSAITTTTTSNEKSEKDNEETTAANDIKLSKRKAKLASRLSVAELKQLVSRPDVVEAHDVTSSDPRLLVTLKALRNTVQVPRHWCAKRKYLQGKRGIEKVPFQLPEFIADTGIAKIRESLIEQENLKKSKQKARDRMQPKMGRIDIDYQVLHDAFFKFQTKPKLSIHGDLYYEGKEFEVHVKDSKPGFLSAQLKEALGMTENAPPPYLINMQRYGPPPSYPSLKIPGLNAPIPAGTSFGYQTGGWGKPPVDEYGRPIYGDVFGQMKQMEDKYSDENVDKKTRWGEITIQEKDEKDDEEESEGDGEDDDDDEDSPKKTNKILDNGMETPMMDGITTTTTGLETPSVIDLRKRSGLDTPNSMYNSLNDPPKDLYKVIPQKQSSQVSGQVFSSDRTYEFSEDTNFEDKPKEADETNEGDGHNGKKKRRLDSTTSVQKLKDFKF